MDCAPSHVSHTQSMSRTLSHLSLTTVLGDEVEDGEPRLAAVQSLTKLAQTGNLGAGTRKHIFQLQSPAPLPLHHTVFHGPAS